MTRIGSLFSGAGGLDLAVEAVFGGHTVWQCEFDAAASKVLAAHWPDIPNHRDVTTTDWTQVEPVDVLCGGFPCQDVSSAGRRAGIRAGTRSGLWQQFDVAIAALRPRFIVIENVRGLLSAQAHRAVESENPTVGNGSDGPVLRAAGAVLGDLADIGYDAQWATVAASSVGAPHRRERVFIVAHASGERHGRRQNGGVVGRMDRPHESQAPEREWPRQLTGDRSATADGPVELLPTPTAGDGAAGCVNRSGARQDELLLGGVVRAYSEGELLATPQAHDAHGMPGNDRFNQKNLCRDVDRMGDNWGKYAAAIHRWEQLTRTAPAPTEPNTKGNPRLAAPFSEWMMGWPAGWVTAAEGISRNDQLKIIGNGVVPQQAVAALRWLLNVCEVAA